MAEGWHRGMALPLLGSMSGCRLKVRKGTPLREARLRRRAMRNSCKNLDDAGKASVEKLRALKAGSEFDRDYIRYEIEGHRKLLDIQEVYLKSPDNLDQANVAKLARGA
jgi:predicted outer membrane protein